MEDNKFCWPFSLKFITVGTWGEPEDIEPLEASGRERSTHGAAQAPSPF